MKQNLNNGVALTLVFVLQSPEFLPLNPFALIDNGLFTKDEIKNGPMDFGPGCVLRSNKGYTIVREVQRVQIMFDSEKTNDQSFVSRVVNKTVESLKIKTIALGVNFSMKITAQLNKIFTDMESKVRDACFGGEMYVPGYLFEIDRGGFRSKISIVVQSGAGPSGVFTMSVNNHFEIKAPEDVENALGRMLRLKDDFTALRQEVFA